MFCNNNGTGMDGYWARSGDQKVEMCRSRRCDSVVGVVCGGSLVSPFTPVFFFFSFIFVGTFFHTSLSCFFPLILIFPLFARTVHGDRLSALFDLPRMCGLVSVRRLEVNATKPLLVLQGHGSTCLSIIELELTGGLSSGGKIRSVFEWGFSADFLCLDFEDRTALVFFFGFIGSDCRYRFWKGYF